MLRIYSGNQNIKEETMQNSAHLVNVLKMAMDDQGFRAALMTDLEGTLKKNNLQTNLSTSEINELKNIFEAGNDQIQFNNLECPYRGYK